MEERKDLKLGQKDIAISESQLRPVMGRDRGNIGRESSLLGANIFSRLYPGQHAVALPEQMFLWPCKRRRSFTCSIEIQFPFVGLVGRPWARSICTRSYWKAALTQSARGLISNI